MKKYWMLFLLALALVGVRPAYAQTPVEAATPLVNQYVADSYEQRSAAWWNALGRQLTLSVDVPLEQVRPATLQNLIFFATHHRKKVKLNDAAPRLLDVYRNHEQEAFRIMALAALHAIADEAAMQKLYGALPYEHSNRVRRLTVAALNDHYHFK